MGMARNTSQMCPKICTSSLQLGVKFSTKRLNTCQDPITTMAMNIAATNSSIDRSIAANSAFMMVPLQTAAHLAGARCNHPLDDFRIRQGLHLPDFVAALLLRQNLLQQMLGLEL